MIKTFCPFLREKCKGNECVMWSDEECLIVSFMEHIKEGALVSEDLSPQLKLEEVPDWIKHLKPESLAKELLDFIREEFPEDEGFSFHTASRYFWESKGIQKFLMPPEVQLKIERVELLAEKELEKEVEEKIKRRLREEREELPSLVSRCIDWAKENGLKRVTLADVDTFLMEKEIELMPQTKRALYSMANLKLKSKKL
ncbi:MAG: hypothetical protein QXU45_03425 [Candidatus Bathyarchaeia archaeon]